MIQLCVTEKSGRHLFRPKFFTVLPGEF